MVTGAARQRAGGCDREDGQRGWPGTQDLKEENRQWQEEPRTSKPDGSSSRCQSSQGQRGPARQQGESARVCEEAEKLLRRELECNLEGWEATGKISARR